MSGPTSEQTGTAVVLAKVYESQGKDIESMAKDWPAIVDEAGALLASEQLRELSTLAKDIEGERKRLSKPAWDTYKGIMDLFAPSIRYCEGAVAALKSKLGTYHKHAEDARLKAMHLMLAGQPASAPPPVVAEGITVIDSTTWELEDATKVPREYCSPDASKIKAALDSGITEIPGIKVTQGKALRVRRLG